MNSFITSRFVLSSRRLALAALLGLGFSQPLFAQTETPVAPDTDVRVFNPAPVRDLIIDTLGDLISFRRKNPLSEEQATAVRAIVWSHRSRILAQVQARLAAARMLRSVINSPDATEQDVREAARMNGEVIGEGALLRREIGREIFKQLRPEQVTAWHDLLDRLEERVLAAIDRV